MYPLDECKKEITEHIQKTITLYHIPYEIRVETPPGGMGDFAFPCFPLAPLIKKSPNDIAKEIAKDISKGKWITKAEAQGGYVNFFIDTTKLTSVTLQSVLEDKETYGYLQKKKKKVIIEHTSANPNGPFHVGRARNPIIGDTLVRLYKAAGYDVESQFYVDDMGKQVAILAWGVHHLEQKDIPLYGEHESRSSNGWILPNSKRTHGKRYHIAEQVGELAKKLERGDHNTLDMIHSCVHTSPRRNETKP